jgi:multiple sugar transport system substrate-binding protein
MSAVLRGIGWDHPRCREPLTAAARQWNADGRGSVDWDYRSLADFNSAALDDLAREYDLLVIDHPMVPHDAALFRPLNDLPAVRAARHGSVGACGTAYDWSGSTFAVPIDVAVHASASRPDLLDKLGEPCPGDWDAVLGLAGRHPGQVLASLSGDDAFCLLLTITASTGQPVTPEREPAGEGVDLLIRLAQACPPECTRMRPPAILDCLAVGQAAYTPALFGYATYLLGAGPRPVYGSVPRFPGGSAAGVMGGAGLAVSAFAAMPEAASEFAQWIISPAVQRDVLVTSGGQPAATAVWDDPSADRALGGFLSQTRQATEAAHIRARHPAWPAYQRQSAQVLHKALPRRSPARDVHAALADVHAKTIGAAP